MKLKFGNYFLWTSEQIFYNALKGLALPLPLLRFLGHITILQELRFHICKIQGLEHDLKGPLKQWKRKYMTSLFLPLPTENNIYCKVVLDHRWDIYICINNTSCLPKEVFIQNLTTNWLQGAMGDKEETVNICVLLKNNVWVIMNCAILCLSKSNARETN